MMARNVDISHINERRLRPIYDCLDNGNNKKALQEAEKVLKKQKGLLCAKVLKALALLRMGKQDESVSILREVHNESPTDDSTLQAMTICYRELQKVELIADVYEMATKKDPTNEELQSHLFMAYMRMNEYKKQYLAAMALHKMKPKNPYYFWAVMSIFMQAISAKDQNIAQKVTLPLAEKMCQKFFDDGKMEAEAEVELYLMVLERQRKFDEMLRVMKSPLGLEKLGNHLDFLARRKTDILKHIGKYEDAFEAYRILIENNIDQLEYYIELYKIAVILEDKLIKDSIMDEKRAHSSYISSLVTLINKCVDKSNRDTLVKNSNIKPFQRQRGPYLAKILVYEFLKTRQQTQGDVQHLIISISNSLTDLLFDYYTEFGSRQACIYDLYYILERSDFKPEDIDILLLQMKQFLLNLSDVNSDLNAMQKHMCYYYVAYYTGQYDSISNVERIKLVEYLLRHYYSCNENIVKNSDLTETEPKPTDPYIILITNILMVAKNELEDNLVFHLMVIMEWALSRSPSNFHFKLLLNKLYNSVGAVSASHALLDSLDIKHIQYDSLGYLFLNPLISCGHFSVGTQFLNNSLKFYSANVKDTLDYLISCYKFGSFTKVEEIIKLRDKLNNSIQYCSSVAEKMILDLILEKKNHQSTEEMINCLDIDLETDKFVWEDICDNRDFSILRCHHRRAEQKFDEKKRQSFADELVWSKLRHLKIRAITAAHYSVSTNLANNELLNNNNKNNSDSNGTANRNFGDISAFCEYVSTLESLTVLKSYLPLESPQPSRIALYYKRSYLKVICSLFEFIIALHNNPKENKDLFNITSGDIFASIVSEIKVTINDNINISSMRSILEDLTNCIETLSFACILIGISQSIMKHNMNISNKKNKKKKENTVGCDYDFILKLYASLVVKFQELAQQIHSIIKSIDILPTISTLEFSLIELTESNKSVDLIKEKLQQSYSQSLKELDELLQNKIKYLQSLEL